MLRGAGRSELQQFKLQHVPRVLELSHGPFLATLHHLNWRNRYTMHSELARSCVQPIFGCAMLAQSPHNGSRWERSVTAVIPHQREHPQCDLANEVTGDGFLLMTAQISTSTLASWPIIECSASIKASHLSMSSTSATESPKGKLYQGWIQVLSS